MIDEDARIEQIGKEPGVVLALGVEPGRLVDLLQTRIPTCPRAGYRSSGNLRASGAGSTRRDCRLEDPNVVARPSAPYGAVTHRNVAWQPSKQTAISYHFGNGPTDRRCLCPAHALSVQATRPVRGSHLLHTGARRSPAPRDSP